MFKIGEFSKICGLSVDTLYHYENTGLLVPSHVDKFTGYRYYDSSQLLTVNKILALKSADFSIKEIYDTITENPSSASLLNLLEKKAISLETSINTEKERLEQLQTNIFLIKNGGTAIMNDITIKKIEPILVASLRRNFPKNNFDDNLEQMWPAVNSHITKNGAKPTFPCLMLYHSGFWDLPEIGITAHKDLLDVETAEPLTKNIRASNEIKVYELAPVDKMACIIHKGPFSSMHKTFDSLFLWVKENGYTACGPIREIYHKGDWVTDDENEYITEIQLPVIKE